MEEMIEACKERQRSDEDIVFAFGVGRMIPTLFKRKAFKEALDYIKKLDGFKGVYAIDLWHNLLVFDTLNNAKASRNSLRAKDIDVGQIVPILVEKQYLIDAE